MLCNIQVLLCLLCCRGIDADGKALMRAVKSHGSDTEEVVIDKAGDVQQEHVETMQMFQVGSDDVAGDAQGHLFMTALQDVSQTVATAPLFSGASSKSTVVGVAPTTRSSTCYVSLDNVKQGKLAVLTYNPASNFAIHSGTMDVAKEYTGAKTYQLLLAGSDTCLVPDFVGRSLNLVSWPCGNATAIHTSFWYFVCGDKGKPGLIQLQWIGQDDFQEFCVTVGPPKDENNETIVDNLPPPSGASCKSYGAPVYGSYQTLHLAPCQVNNHGVDRTSVQALGATFSSYQCGAMPYMSVIRPTVKTNGTQQMRHYRELPTESPLALR